METAEKSLNDMVSAADYDTTRYFVEEEASRKEREGDGGGGSTIMTEIFVIFSSTFNG